MARPENAQIEEPAERIYRLPTQRRKRAAGLEQSRSARLYWI